MSKTTFPIAKSKIGNPADTSLQREYASMDSSTTQDNKVEAEPNYTRFMVGTYLDPKTGEWMLGYAAFDPVTETIGDFQKERCAGDREVMLERLSIKQINLGLFNSEPIKEEKKEEIY